jgi:hypothetical protein
VKFFEQGQLLFQSEKSRQKGRQGREKDGHQQGGQHDGHKGNHRFGDLLQRKAGDIGDHIKVYRHRWRDLADGQIEGHDDPEPDRVPMKIGYDGDKNGQKHIMDGYGVHQHTGDKRMRLIKSRMTMGLEERARKPAEALSITPRVEPVQEKSPAKATMNMTTAEERTASLKIS